MNVASKLENKWFPRLYLFICIYTRWNWGHFWPVWWAGCHMGEGRGGWRTYAPGFYKWVRVSISVPVTTQVKCKQWPSVWPGKLTQSHYRDAEQNNCRKIFFFFAGRDFTPTFSHHPNPSLSYSLSLCVHRTLLWLHTSCLAISILGAQNLPTCHFIS